MFAFALNIKTNDEVKIFVSRLFCFFLRHKKNCQFAFSVIAFIIALLENVINL